jgi:hypothetical protein
MTRFLLCLIAVMLAAAPAAAQDFAGRWAARSGGRPVMIVSIETAGEGWRGAWLRPTRFSADATFGMLLEARGPVSERRLLKARRIENALELTFAPRPGETRPDIMMFRVLADGTARITWADMAGAVLVVDRAAAGEAPIAYDPAAVYAIDQHWPTNAEMTAIFKADQVVRTNWASADHAQMARDDAARLARTRALLDTGALNSGTDFFHAAFIFQHGGASANYLLAHNLAMVAVARGRADATWIATATLDRYLQSVGQKQVFGTQFQTRPGTPTTQEPYDRALVPDALRNALGVPPLAGQEAQRRMFEEEARKGAKR